MKKKIVFGSLLACFLMMMTPNVSAVEYQTVVDTNESYLMKELKDRDLDIDALRDKIKDINIREFREAVRNIDVDELKEKIMLELENSDLTEQQKAYVEQLLDSGFLLTIIIKGIIIPVILYVIALGSVHVFPDFPLSLLLSIVIPIAVPVFFLSPVLELIQEETGSFLLGSIAYWLLFLIDFTLAKIIVDMIFQPSYFK